MLRSRVMARFALSFPGCVFSLHLNAGSNRPGNKARLECYVAFSEQCEAKLVLVGRSPTNVRWLDSAQLN